MIDGTRIENVTEFVYLGSLFTWVNDCSKEEDCTSNWSDGRIQESVEQHAHQHSLRTKLSIMRNERAYVHVRPGC